MLIGILKENKRVRISDSIGQAFESSAYFSPFLRALDLIPTQS
jgi:hypothetical protein